MCIQQNPKAGLGEPVEALFGLCLHAPLRDNL
jgi:hypothetical protein